MLLNIFASILELPIDLAFQEAPKKLQGTYMILNEELVYISQIETEDSMLVKTKTDKLLEIEGDAVESLEVWLPETGISLISPDNRVFVYKYPERQWHKSFNYNFYSTSLMDKIIQDWEIPFLVFENGIIPTNKPYIFQDSIHYLDKYIGDVNGKEIIVVDKRFFQESYETFSKDYNVCLKN